MDSAPALRDDEALEQDVDVQSTAAQEKAEHAEETPSTKASPETRAQILALLAEVDHPPLREIAKTYGLPTSTIHRWDERRREALKAAGTETTASTAEHTEAEFRRRTPRALPVRMRVAALRDILTANRDVTAICKCKRMVTVGVPIASDRDRMAAIALVNELEGVVTAKQRREAEAGGNTVQPLFALPTSHCPGCQCPPGAARGIGIMAMVAPVKVP